MMSSNSTAHQIWDAECQEIFDVPRLASMIITILLIFVQILQNFTDFVHLKIYLPRVHMFTYRQTAVFLSQGEDLDEFEERAVDTAYVPSRGSSAVQPYDINRKTNQTTQSHSNRSVGISDIHLLLFVHVKEDVNPFKNIRESKWLATMIVCLDRLEWILQKPTYPLLPLMDWIQKEKLSARIDVTCWSSSFLYGRSVGHLYCTILICLMLFCPAAFYVNNYWKIVALVVGFLLFLVQVKLFCTGHFTHFFYGIGFGFLAALTWTPTGLLRNCFLSLLTIVYFIFLNIILNFYFVASWIVFFSEYCSKLCTYCRDESCCWGCIIFYFTFDLFYIVSILIAYGVVYSQYLSIPVFLIMNIIPFIAEFKESHEQIDLFLSSN